MPLLYFDTDADTALARLEADPSQSLLLRRMNELLDVLETDPADPRVRRVRFQRPRLWCFTVFTADEEWAVLWEPHPEEADAVIVRYLAPASFA